ncbi:MAG TPA: GNAT family N-acetyltransferase [Gemmatimonadales bacterium]|nr:GNAT family N-acetyltransferase [Gemmatimonadales bacterium]
MDDAGPGVIRRATPNEAPLLNALTGRSALFWGYEPEFLDWEPESLRVTGELIADSPVFVLEEDGRVLGYYALLAGPEGWYLDKLFVEPDRIGTGRGKRLWRHAMATARGLGAESVTLYADPNAAPFYRAMGATWLREEPTSRPGWNLQVFRFDFADGPEHASNRHQVGPEQP